MWQRRAATDESRGAAEPGCRLLDDSRAAHSLTLISRASHAPCMVRAHSYLVALALLAAIVVVLLMVAGVVPAQRSSVLGALIAAEATNGSSQPTPTVTPIDRPVSFDGLRPGVTEAFGLRDGLVVLQVIYDGTVEPFSASLRLLGDPNAEPIAPVSIIPPLSREGGAAAQIARAGSYVLNVERAEGEWAITIAQPGDAGGAG